MGFLYKIFCTVFHFGVCQMTYGATQLRTRYTTFPFHLTSKKSVKLLGSLFKLVMELLFQFISLFLVPCFIYICKAPETCSFAY